MKKINISLMLVCIVAMSMLVLAGCSSDEPNQPTKAPLIEIELEAEQLPYIESTNQFAVNLWNEINAEADRNNFIVSPLSLQMGLSLLANGASGETYQELSSVLLPEFDGTASLDRLNQVNSMLLEKLPKTDSKAKIKLANSIWMAHTLTPIKSFEDRVNRYYGASIFNFIPGSESDRKAINDWCSNATSGMIDELFKSAPEEDIMLINALSFKHDWARQFDKSKTKKEYFYSQSGTSEKVEMMKDAYKGEVYVTDEAWMVRRPYGNGAFVMELYKPLDGYTVAEAVSAGVGVSYDRNINLGLPKVNLESELDFKKVLKSMGLSHALDEMADYSGMSDTKLMIEKIFQKSKIEIDENGTTVVSVTTISGVAAPPPPKDVDFTLNHPFGFVIRETSTNVIVAMGKISEL